MSEMQEEFEAMREIAAEKRKNNLHSSTAILEEHGIAFESKNCGYHLIIRTASGPVNFWPSTGRFSGSIEGRGIFNLLQGLKKIQVGGTGK